MSTDPSLDRWSHRRARDPVAGADRYARHRIIAGFSQESLQAGRFAVIGAGAIGNEVVKNLCLLGVGAIDVYDFDTVELHNLTRSVLLREADVGTGKAAAVARRARELDPAVAVRPVAGDLWDTLDFATLRGYRCVIAALDNFEARLRVNLLCWIAGVDWVNAAIDSRYVTVETFRFSRAGPGAPVACYECGLPASAYQRIAERYSCGGLQRMAARERVVPTTAITASFAGAQAVNRALGAADAGSGEVLPAERWLLDTRTGRAGVAELVPAPLCPCCGDLPGKADIVALPGGDARAIDDAARAAGADSVRLADRLVWHCRCVNCGSTAATAAVELRAAARVPDTVAFCMQCRSPAVSVELRDEFEPGELSERFAPGAPVPTRFALVGDTCLDMLAGPADPAKAAAPEADAAQPSGAQR